jgi:hypothetical protein
MHDDLMDEELHVMPHIYWDKIHKVFLDEVGLVTHPHDDTVHALVLVSKKFVASRCGPNCCNAAS